VRLAVHPNDQDQAVEQADVPICLQDRRVRADHCKLMAASQGPATLLADPDVAASHSSWVQVHVEVASAGRVPAAVVADTYHEADTYQGVATHSVAGWVHASLVVVGLSVLVHASHGVAHAQPQHQRSCGHCAVCGCGSCSCGASSPHDGCAYVTYSLV